MQPRDQDILFGDIKFLEQHAGTKRWAAIVGSYSRQSYWSDIVYQNIRNDKRLQGRNYLMLLLPGGGGGGRQANKFRSATEEEIEGRTWTVFNHGGGKKRSSSTTTTTTTTMTKRRKLGHNKNTMTTNDGKKNENDSDDDAEIVIRVGDDVYAFDQLWRASVVEQSDGFDGTKYLVSYAGFRRDQDNWVDEFQLFPANTETTRWYEKLDKSQLTAFENDDNCVGGILGSGTTTRRSSKRRFTKTSKKAVTTKSVKTKGEFSSSPQTPIHIASSPDLLAGEEMADQSTASDRGWHTPTTAAGAVALDDMVDLEKVYAQAASKCESALKQSNEAGILGSPGESIVAGEVAAWTQQTLSNLIFRNENGAVSLSSLPNAREMEQKAERLKEGGGFKGLQALALERQARKWNGVQKQWNEVQKQLANIVQYLVEDL